MSVLIVADPGSTHCGRRKNAFELVDRAAEAGADVIKFQLFPKEMAKGGNQYLPYDWFRTLHLYGKDRKRKEGARPIKVAASVYDQEAMSIVAKLDVPFVKFGYSMRNKRDNINGFLNLGKQVIVSTDVMGNDYEPHDNLKRLFVYTEQGKVAYPVIAEMNFRGLFPAFDGLSDHSLDVTTPLNAVGYGAKIIEKHLTLEYTESLQTPDGKFALTPPEFKKMVDGIRAQG